MLVAETKQGLQAILQQIGAELDAGASGNQLASRMCREVDTLLTGLWREKAPQAAEVVDLVAVGGYGRGELAPYSDWDLWFLVPESCPKQVEEEIQAFLYTLWDMKVKVGYAVRTVAETLEHLEADWTSATAGLESRLLAGSGNYFAAMQKKFAAFLKRRRKAFVAAKLAELDVRQAKTGGTAFLMEPDIKEGKGGLRDVQAIFWMAKAWYDVPRIGDLVSQGAISPTEYAYLQAAQDFLWRCRVALHLEVKRASDRLGFEQQVALAERMGYQADGHRPAVEVFMKDYFRAAGRIARVTGMLLLHFREQLNPQRFVRTRDIGDGFTLEGQKVGVKNDKVFRDDKLRLLRIFHVAQQDHRRLSSQALRQIRADMLLIDDEFRADPEAQQLFLRILRSKRNVHWALKEMNDTGVLGRFIPEFRDVVGLGQFNRYHAYAVDEHTIRAVGEARNFWHGERECRLSLARDVCQKLHRPELLYVALLFHDIAKGVPGDHSVNGAAMARRFCERLGLNEDDTSLVEWLVREHLYMAVTSQRSDISDPEVVRNFARHVSDIGRLNYLFLLTIADIAAVGPNVWNDWKGMLLRELYQSTQRLFLGESMQGEAVEKRLATRLASALDLAQGERARLAHEMSLLPRRCIMHFPPRQLSRIGELLVESNGGEVVRVLFDEERSDTLALIIGRERPALFTSLTATLTSGHTNIVAAQAFELDDGRVLDVFHIQAVGGGPLDVASDLQRLQKRLADTLAAEKPVVPSMEKPKKASILMRRVAVSVAELPLASSRHTAIEVVAADRPGLLAQMAYVISQSGYHIRNANITTFGERVVDVFFLTGANWEKLAPEQVAGLCDSLAEVAKLPEES